MTNTEIPQDLNQNTAPTSNDSIGSLKETASSIVHVREINRTEIEISSMLRSTAGQFHQKEHEPPETEPATQLSKGPPCTRVSNLYSEGNHHDSTVPQILREKREREV
ncbi:hypothetical protein DY000_02005345 [Brassica cretica]|uniref:Uncharacterized protein n=1 Tax=Brassica cretica TaxID=69181 RepID=A0ABQ7C0P8_BRACR|nr:hypothetical protein DY000_02005345 [Brassica cretica]